MYLVLNRVLIINNTSAISMLAPAQYNNYICCCKATMLKIKVLYNKEEVLNVIIINNNCTQLLIIIKTNVN